MLGLPKSTEMKKQLPKSAIFRNYTLNTSIKDKLNEDISKLTLVNEISKATCSIPSGENVSSFYVLLVSLKQKEYSDASIIQLTKLINQNLLMILEYEDHSKLAIYRTRLIATEWKKSDKLSIQLAGMNLDAVWNNITKNIEGGEWNDSISIEDNLLLHEQNKETQKKIKILEKKAWAEKQPKKKYEFVQQINRLKSK